MDLRVYYQRIRDMQQTIGDSFAVVVSRETPDGGKPGVKSEVPRDLAARMIVDGRARLASEEEAREFQEWKAEAKRVADQLEAASRIQLTVLTENDLRGLKVAGKSPKS